MIGLEESAEAPTHSSFPCPQEFWAASWWPSPHHNLLSGSSLFEFGPPKRGWGEDVSRVSSSQAPTQRENTQREGWAFQQWPEGKSEVGPCLPRGHREEQPGASRPLGKASTHQDNRLAGTAGKPPGLGNLVDEGPEGGGGVRVAPWKGVAESFP